MYVVTMEYCVLRRKRTKGLVALLAIAVATFSLITFNATTAQSSTYTVPFNSNSIWNRPIGTNPALNAKSAQMIQLLASTVGTSVNIDGINGAWSVPVYYAPAGTPLQQVCDTNDYRPCEMVPVPAGMFPSPDGDAKTVIIDLSLNRAWSFYGIAKGDGSNGDWTSLNGAFGWGYTSSQGDGIHNYGGGMWGGRVTGWNYVAGLIHPEEIQAGVINHALVFMIPSQIATSGTYVWPAASTDGSSTNTSAIPLGSRIQLDPSINVSTLPLTAGGKMIARALQVYGGWIADTGSAAAVDAQEFVTSNGQGVNATPWQGLLTYRDLYGIPVSSFRVLQVNQGDFYVEGSSPPPTNTPTRAPTATPTHAPTAKPTTVPTQAALPMSAPTVYDSMNTGAPNWKVLGGTWKLTSGAAYGGSGLGWLATGSTAVNRLRWQYLIDLRSAPNAYLWAQSLLTTGNTATVQASLDGTTWSSVGTIGASSSWKVSSINLSAYVGKIIQLQFVWMPKLATDAWKLDDLTIGVLQTATATPTHAPTATPTTAPTQVTLPMRAPTVYDSMNTGAPNWKVLGGTWKLTSGAAYGGSGLGWLATGSTAVNRLRWQYLIDLRSAPNAYLWVQSLLTTGNTATVQASLDGTTWSSVGTIGASSSWKVPSINLSAYVGKIIQLQFVWMPKLATDTWKLDDLTIGVLQTTQVNLVQPISPPTLAALVSDAPQSLAQTIPGGYTAVESDASAVSRVATWQTTGQPGGASGGSFLINTDPGAILSLPFQGNSVGVAFVTGPSFGQFTIEVDGVARQVVNTNAPSYQFGQMIVNDLDAGAHTVRVIPSAGVVGIDAFLVPAAAAQIADLPTQTPMNVPTALSFPTLDIPVDLGTPTASVPTDEAATPGEPPTALPFPTLDIPVDLATPTSDVATVVPALPMSAPTVYDSMDEGAQDWQATGNWNLTSSAAYGGAGLGWQASGGTANVLRWNRLIDLSNVPNAYLWVQSMLSTGSTAYAQASLDGSNWTTVGSIVSSSSWYVPSIDLSAYIGQVIQLQFVWTSGNPGDVWQLDDVTVGVLGGAPVPSPTASNTAPVETATLAATVPTSTTAAPTSTLVPPSPTATQTSTSVPTQVPTQPPPATDVPIQAPAPAITPLVTASP